MALNIGAGDLNRKVFFKAPVITKDDGGSQDVSYPFTTLTLWAAVKDINQTRALEAGVSALIDSKEFIIRWAANRVQITKDFLMLFEGIEHTIESIEKVDDKFLKIVAKSKTNG